MQPSINSSLEEAFTHRAALRGKLRFWLNHHCETQVF